MAKILIIEAFYGGSHKQLLDTILADFASVEYDLFTLPANKWHWRARTSALHFSQIIPMEHSYETIFTTTVLNLAELVGMRPDLTTCKKIVYFHENQLIYPVQIIKERDCQYGLNEIMTCLAADHVIFNSNFNKFSFLDSIDSFLKIQPDMKLKNLRQKIEPKCAVLYFPINFHQMPFRPMQNESKDSEPLHLVWPHRWEHDKNPVLLANVLFELDQRGVPFMISIVGEQYDEQPDCFDDIQKRLATKIQHLGYLTRANYLKCLTEADIVISTADHEFYGVSMLEAVYCGCVPIAPNKLVYPEIYPKTSLYNTDMQLVKMLQNWCRHLSVFQKYRRNFFESFELDMYSSKTLVPKFVEFFRST